MSKPVSKPGEWQIDLRAARVLLTNDDGLNAPGLELLERLITPLAREVWVVAPEKEESGTGHAFSLHRPLRLREAGPRRFAVDGLPADAAILALGEVMKDTPPDIVLSGVNRGANIGDDVNYSGTVGAAAEAALSGFPALSLSLDRAPRGDAKWATVESHLADTVQWLLAASWPKGIVLNVNFPDVEPNDVLGRRVTRLGRRKPGGAIAKGVDPAGRPYHWISSERVYGEVTADSDIQAARDGWISMTPLTMDMTDEANLALARERLT